MTKISFDEWQAAVVDVARSRVDQVPAGWVTPEQMTVPGTLTRNGLGHRHATRVLHELFVAGKAERKQFMIETTDGMVRKVYHYRLKK